MVINLKSKEITRGASAISYALTKKRDIKKDDINKKNDNVIFLCSHHLDVNNILDSPSPSDIYRQMKLRQEVAGLKRKYGFWNIRICPSKEDWKALLGFEPVPGKITDSQKEKIIEVANKLIDTSIKKMDVTDHWGYRHNKKGETYSCITGKHTNLTDSQSVWSIHLDTDDIHIHGVANMVTEQNEIQDSNMCIDRGFLAGDKVAENFGLKNLSEYDNQRKEKIHADGITALKLMGNFDLKLYFAMMAAKGWIIEPNTPDVKGVIHGYSIGEKLYHNDGSLSSIIMFKSSELGHSKDLTPSHLFKTWMKVHKEEVEKTSKHTNTIPKRWGDEWLLQRQREKSELEERRAKAKLQKIQKPQTKLPSESEKELSNSEMERNSAIRTTRLVLNNFCKSTFSIFDRDEVFAIKKGIVAKCIEYGGHSWIEDDLKKAADSFFENFDEKNKQQVRAKDLFTEIVDLLLPVIQASAGGGGGNNNDLPKSKDDEWLWLHKNLFGMGPGRKRR